MPRDLPAPRLVTFGRAEFLAERWRADPGEHVTVLGPTGCGKTTLLLQLAGASASPSNRAVLLVMKPRDATVAKFVRAQGWPVVRSWPPLPTLPGRAKPSGLALWPRHTFDPVRDDALMAGQFRKVMQESYKKGKTILLMDEADSVGDLRDGPGAAGRLDVWHRTILKRGRSMGCASWQSTQRPFGLIQEAYSQASHLFLFNDPDKRSTDRFAEIGGVDADLLKAAVKALPKYHALYVKRDGPRVCIVAP